MAMIQNSSKMLDTNGFFFIRPETKKLAGFCSTKENISKLKKLEAFYIKILTLKVDDGLKRRDNLFDLSNFIVLS